MAYEVMILCHLHMPLYFLGTFTEYPYLMIRSSPGRTSMKALDIVTFSP